MSREIKFRAWDTRFKIMVSEEPNGYGIMFSGGMGLFVSRDHMLPSDDFELMQFIGLYDCKGNEVFEGDIVQSDSHRPNHFSIEFDGGNYWACHPSLQYKTDIQHFYPSTGCEFEIVGNVHQHPELLQEAEK